MTLTQLRRQVERLGGTLEVDKASTYRLTADAPAGHVWSASHTHCMVAESHFGDRTWLESARQDLSERVQYGIEVCTADECDYCEEQGVRAS